MAQIEGLQVNIQGNVDGLKRAATEAANKLGDIAKSADAASRTITEQLDNAASSVTTRYGSLAGSVASSLASLVNPAALAASAITALGAGLLAYYNSVQEQVPTVDETLKMHAGIIASLKASYGEAAKGLGEYAKSAEKVYQTEVLADQQRMLSALTAETEKFLSQVSRTLPALDEMSMRFGDVNAAGLTTKRGLEAFTTPLTELQNQLRNGSINIIEFRDGVDRIAMQLKENGSPEAIKFGDEILRLTKNLAQLTGGLNQTAPSIDLLTGAMQRGQEAAKVYETTLKTLEGIAPKKIDDITKAQNSLTEALKNQNLTEEQRTTLINASAAAQKRAADAAAERVKAPKVSVDNSADQLAREQEMITKRLEMLTLGWGTEQERLAAHLVRNQDLITQARSKEVIDDETHKALMLGAEEEYQKKMEAMRMAGINSALTATGEVFSAMGRVVQAGGKKNVRLAKMFGIAEAIIATMVAANKAMAVSASAGPAAAFAAWAAVAAKGLATVAAIRSVNEGGGGGGGAASAGGGGGAAGGEGMAGAGGGAPGGNSVYINLQGQSFGRDQVRDLVKQIADFQKDGGQVVFA